MHTLLEALCGSTAAARHTEHKLQPVEGTTAVTRRRVNVYKGLLLGAGWFVHDRGALKLEALTVLPRLEFC